MYFISLPATKVGRCSWAFYLCCFLLSLTFPRERKLIIESTTGRQGQGPQKKTAQRKQPTKNQNNNDIYVFSKPTDQNRLKIGRLDPQNKRAEEDNSTRPGYTAHIK